MRSEPKSLTVSQRTILFCARLYLLAAHPVLVSRFIEHLGFWPNPAVPRRYHEKILWRKIVDRNAIFVHLSNKLAAKRSARRRCRALAIARVLWVGTDPWSLPIALVRQDVAVKANHAAGTNIFVTDGQPEYAKVVKKADRWMLRWHHRRHGEWGYRDVPRLLFIEEKLVLGGGDLPTDIKVHVFSTGVSHIWVADKLSGRSRTYSADLTPLEVRDRTYPNQEQILPDSPASQALIRQALELAPRLLGGLDYARIDFMVAGNRLYFGEYTFYPGGGHDPGLDRALAERAEELWDLRASDFLRKRHRGLVRLHAEALRAAIATNERGPASAGTAPRQKAGRAMASHAS